MILEVKSTRRNNIPPPPPSPQRYQPLEQSFRFVSRPLSNRKNIVKNCLKIGNN